MLVHLATIDLEALTELDIGLGDDLLEQHLALDQGQLSQVMAVEIQQIERGHHGLGRFALEFVLQN